MKLLRDQKGVVSRQEVSITLLISFEIMSNFVQISQVKFTGRLFYYTANPSALVPTTLHF